jgi:hypothetical protein
VNLSFDFVQDRLVARGLHIPTSSVASTVAAVNTGKHVAFVADPCSDETTLAFAETVADCAAALDFCIGWLNLYRTTAALLNVTDIVRARFVSDLWIILTRPSPTAISQVVDEVRRGSRESTEARLLVVTSAQSLREAKLSPAGRRTLIPILL